MKFRTRGDIDMLKTTSFLAVAGFAVMLASPAQAQSTRTWVSGVGDDVNPCSRTAPCKTFAGAISKTAAGGEINCLDPGGFGVITITKAITIDCTGTLGGILSAGSPGAATINAGANDKVVLRGITIDGAGTGTNGVRFIAGREVTVENVNIVGITGTGVEVTVTGPASPIGILNMNNVTMTRINKGVRLAPAGGAFGVASITNTRIWGATTTGVELATNNAVAAVDNSIVSEMFPTSGTGFHVLTGTNGVLMVENSQVTNNSTGFNVAGGTVRISNNGIYDNSNAFTVAGGTLVSANNNRVAPNSAVVPGVIQIK
jgi:hypothetical protein